MACPSWEGGQMGSSCREEAWDPESLHGSEQVLPCRGAGTDGAEKGENQEAG